jgi:hypothetical protein
MRDMTCFFWGKRPVIHLMDRLSPVVAPFSSHKPGYKAISAPFVETNCRAAIGHIFKAAFSH